MVVMSQPCGNGAQPILPPGDERSAPCRIFTYASASDDLPPHERAIARIKCPMVSGFGKTRAVNYEWHPVILYAATCADAHAKALAWWNAQVERERTKGETAAKRATMMRERAAARRNADTSSATVPLRDADT